MNFILGFLALLIVTLLGFNYVFLEKKYFVKSPWNKRVKVKVSSKQRFVLLLLATAIVQAGSFSSLLLLVWMLFLIRLLLKYGFNFSASPMFKMYTFYLFWLLISLVMSPEKEYGFRVFAKYLFPFLLVLSTASMKNSETFFLKALKVSFFSGIFINSMILLMKIVPIYTIYSPVLWWQPAVIDANPFFIAAGMVLYNLVKKKSVLIAILLISIIPVIESVRTGIIAIGIFLLVASFFKYKLKALPVFGIIIVTFVSSILFIPSVRDKMFKDTFDSASAVIGNSSKLSFDDIDTNGRSNMWEWVLNTYYKGHEVAGSGLGQVQARLCNGDLFGGINVVHNDYIQILADTGQVGLVLYLLIIVSFVWHCFKIYNNKKNNWSARNAAFIAGTSFCGIMAAAFTDNVINYSLITLTYPYAFFGFALALKSKIKQ